MCIRDRNWTRARRRVCSRDRAHWRSKGLGRRRYSVERGCRYECRGADWRGVLQRVVRSRSGGGGSACALSRFRALDTLAFWFRNKPAHDRVPEHGSKSLSLIHISEPTRLLSISYAVFCLKKKKKD